MQAVKRDGNIEEFNVDKIISAVEKAFKSCNKKMPQYLYDMLGALFGSLLQIRPILTIEDGKTTVLNKVRTKKKAVNAIIDTVVEQNSKTPLKGLIVHHINCENEGKELANSLKEKLGIDNIKIQSIGPLIGLHVGPGSIGVAYHY